MKKLLTFVIVVTFLASAIQPADATTIDLIPKIGLNFANASFDPDLPAELTKSARMGVFLGLGAEFGFDTFGVETGLLYSQKGYKIEFEDVIFGVTVKSESVGKIDYLTIPIILKGIFNTGAGSIGSISLGLGPEIALLMSAKSWSKSEIDGVTTETEVDIKDNIEFIDIGFIIYASAEISGLVLDFRYTLGLTNFIKNKDFKRKHNVISVLFGYKFSLQ